MTVMSTHADELQDSYDQITCFKIKLTTEFTKVFQNLEKKYNSAQGMWTLALASSSHIAYVRLYQGVLRWE
jgi:hypothetical protein